MNTIELWKTSLNLYNRLYNAPRHVIPDTQSYSHAQNRGSLPLQLKGLIFLIINNF